MSSSESDSEPLRCSCMHKTLIEEFQKIGIEIELHESNFYLECYFSLNRYFESIQVWEWTYKEFFSNLRGILNKNS